MRAIVLTFDKQIGCAELLYKKYMELWPNSPLLFHIAYNEKEAIPRDLLGKDNIFLIKTPTPIRATMMRLLEGVGDNEWVYWCIDDRYPIEIRSIRFIENLCKLLSSEDFASNYSAIRLFRWKEKPPYNRVDFLEKEYIEVRSLKWGFWHHQFIRAKVLKDIFVRNKILKEVYSIRALNDKVVSEYSLDSLILTPGEDESSIFFAEPVGVGKLTKNGYLDLVKYKCKVPEYGIKEVYQRFVDKNIPKNQDK